MGVLINISKKRILTYAIICEAVKGNTKAEDAIFDYYEPYIIKLSKIAQTKANGRIDYIIDEDIYMNLKMKLHLLIQGFKIP